MARKLIVEIVGDSRSLEKAFKKSSKSANTFGRSMDKTASKTRRSFGGLGKGVGLVAGAIGTAGLVGGLRATIGEMNEAQKVTAQTNAVLKSTGKVANVSAKQVDALALSLMNKTGIDDEAIKTSENLLLTFTDIRNEAGKGNKIFDKATKAALDLSVRFDKDLSSSAIMVGKALNDPIKGVTALSRAGVQFTKQQKDQIKTLVESGKTLEAQKLILSELEKQTGGAAEAYGDTLGGKLNLLRNTVLNLSATLLTQLTPAITRLVDRAVKWLTNTKNQEKILNTVRTAAKALATGLNVLRTGFNTLSKIVGGNENAIKTLIVAYGIFKAAQFAAVVTRMVSSFGFLTTAVRTNTGATRTATVANRAFAASFLGKAGIAAGAAFAGYELSKLIRKIPGWDKAMKKFGETVYDVFAGLGGGPDPAAAEAAARARILTRHPRFKLDKGGHIVRRDRPLQVNVQVDGKTIARATAQPTENEQARRRRQRAHQRKSRR